MAKLSEELEDFEADHEFALALDRQWSDVLLEEKRELAERDQQIADQASTLIYMINKR